MSNPSPRAFALRPMCCVGMTLLAALALLLPAMGGTQAARWGRTYFGDHKVVTQHGKTLRFYDDLIKDKVFVISFLYTSCEDFCPLVASRLSVLQEKLADVMGREIFFYSISIDPEVDTPKRLKDYADTFGAGPGWLFLTGKPEDIHAIRDRLGDRSKFLSEHRNGIILGNGATGEFARDNALSDLKRLEITLRSMDPKWRDTVGRRVAAQTRPGVAHLTGRHTAGTTGPIRLDARPGQALYLRMCAGCHTVGGGDRVGPDLAGIMGRRNMDWLKDFISQPAKMRAQKDPIALSLVAKYPVARMPPLGVGKNEVADLLGYVAYLEQKNANRAHPLENLFGLTTHKGGRLSAKDVEGKPVAVFFGFTHCPDVCPTTLMDWSNVLHDLGEDGDRLKVLFVSVDSERDTPEALAAYLSSFDPRITALTGKAADIARAARAFGAFYERHGGSDKKDYTFDHTTTVYLVGRDGKVMGKPNLRTPEKARREMLAGLLSPE